MKKIRVFSIMISLLLLMCFMTGCKKIPVISMQEQLTLTEGEVREFKPTVENLKNDQPIFNYEISDESIVKIENNSIEALKEGKVTITIKLQNNDSAKAIIVEVTVSAKPVITITPVNTLYVGATEQLNINTNIEGTLQYSSSNEDVATVSNTGLVTTKGVGTCQIRVQSGDVYSEITITVVEEPVLEITNVEKSHYVNQTLQLNINTNIEGTLQYSSSNEDVATVSNTGLVKFLENGTVTITVEAENLSDEIDLVVNLDGVLPEFKYAESFKLSEQLNWNNSFDPLSGITATDNIDGDITSKIEVTGSVDPKSYGKYELVYKIVDSSNNEATITRTVEVVWNYDVQFIGHAGSYYGLMNSEEAILYAINTLKYQAVEVDLKQTSDGVFILSHDDTFADYQLNATTWEVLKNVERTASRSQGLPSQNGSVVNSPYTAKLCTLERFLEICKQYNVKPVIELKSSKGITNTDQSRMQAFMDVVEKHDMVDQVILLGSQYNCLIWTRNNGYETVNCQYLVNSCESQTVLDRCINNNLNVSINVTGTYTNSDEWLAKYWDAGLEVSTYTYTQWVDYSVVQTWIDKGVQYVTCDWHKMDELKLPVTDPTLNQYHTVSFYDSDEQLLKTVKVKQGRTAAAPKNPSKEGYEFIGWDQTLTNIQSDLTVTAQYRMVNYNITFVANSTVTEKIDWATKADFVTEFYTDLFNWFTENTAHIQGHSISNGVHTLVRNSVTITFANVDQLKAIDIYDFEKTVGNVIYKLVERDSSGQCTIEIDESYFLNSSKYRDKYLELDQWFYNCCITAYPAYNANYGQTSNGRVQIMFRFHQWQKGTSIASFNTLPKKTVVQPIAGLVVEMPENRTYTIEDLVLLPNPVSNVEFLGWYLTSDCTGDAITTIPVGSSGNVTLYAKWDLSTLNSEN